jgi:hypothetical protein
MSAVDGECNRKIPERHVLQHVRVVAFAIYREISDELELQIVLKEVATLPKLIDDPDIV